MGEEISQVEVLRTERDREFHPTIPVFHLRWDPDSPQAHCRAWLLPERLSLEGPPPARLAFQLRPAGGACYAVRLLWDHTQFRWSALGRQQLLGSCLPELLELIGIDLWALLDSDGRAAPPKSAA